LIGIPYQIADEEILIRKEYLGQYGSIHKLIVNKNGYMKNESNFPTYSSYITYSNEIEASLALLSLNNSVFFNQKLNACYGTNKYCISFLKGIECNNKECFYLHEMADKNDIIIKNDSQMKIQFMGQQKEVAAAIANIFAEEQKNIYIQKGLEMKKEFEEKKIENFFPTIDTIYEKKYIQELEKEKDINNINDKYIINNTDYYYQLYSPNISYNKKKKYKTYKLSSPQSDKFIGGCNLIEDEDENDEYILVRQPSRHKKKHGGNKNFYKKNYYKKSCKLKFTLEKYKIKYNIREAEILPSPSPKFKLNNNSGETISSYNTNESSSQNNQQDESDLKKIFCKNSKKSRFSFANQTTENDCKTNIFLIPDYISEIVNKKFSFLNFSNILGIKDIKYWEEILLGEEIKKIDKWMKE
jgi:uncharacterized protein YhbP (UPF0306 family)